MDNGLNVLNMNAILSASLYYQYKNGAIKLPKAVLCLPSFSLFLKILCGILKDERDHIQILLLILSEARINFFTPVKLSENIWFFDDFRGNRS